MRQKTKMLICEGLVADGADVTIAGRMSFVLDDRQVDAIAAGVIIDAQIREDCMPMIERFVTDKMSYRHQKPFGFKVSAVSYDTLRIDYCCYHKKSNDEPKDAPLKLVEGEKLYVLCDLFEHPEAEAWFNIKYV